MTSGTDFASKVMKYNGKVIDGIALSVEHDRRSKAYILTYKFGNFSIPTRYDTGLHKEAQHYLSDEGALEDSVQKGLIYAKSIRERFKL